MSKRVTLATIKAFIRRHRAELLISYLSDFDSMTDCVQPCSGKGFVPAQEPDEGRNHSNCLGIRGAWFVFDSRDYFEPIERDGVTGYHVYNGCGSFDIGVRTSDQRKAV